LNQIVKILKPSRILVYIFFIVPFFFVNCNNSSSGQSLIESGYSDGSYCAEVQYYYSETGTRTNYTLLVEINNNELVKIHWPNGGWLDNSHFSPPNITNGYAQFTSDRGVDYTVKILGKEGNCVLSSTAQDEDQLIEENQNQKEQVRRQKEEDEERAQEKDNSAKEEEENRVKQEEEDKKRQLEQQEEEDHNKQDEESEQRKKDEENSNQ
jgi:flagellar biosynthesis GTPase FlhF